MITAETMYLLTMHLLLGILLVMIIFSGYSWMSTKDRMLVFYILYMVGGLIIIGNKYIDIFSHNYKTSFTEVTWLDNMFSASVMAIPYTIFLYDAFSVKTGSKWLKFSWYFVLTMNISHFIYLPVVKLIGVEDYYEIPFGSALLGVIFLATLFLIASAFFIKNKTRFQALILSGFVVYISMFLLAAVQEYYFKSGLLKGMTGFYLALTGEMIFFALASSQRITDVYNESEKLKVISYQYQLEIEQVTNFFATSINQQNSVDDMLWDVSKNCISKLGFEDCVIYLKDETKNVLVQKAAWGPKTNDDDRIVNPIEIPIGKGIVGTVGRTGIPENIGDTSMDSRYIIDDASRYSELAVPIIQNDIVVGVIDSENSQKGFYTQRHLQILVTIASLCASKMEKIAAEEQTREKEIEVFKLSKDMANWQITALRAQMNPHFLFNAMNSIQQFTLAHDTINANIYLSKFSTLLRKVLHSSQQPLISVEEEVEQLELYLSIEQLRMGVDFTYKISFVDEFELDAVKIPGMLIQPFVENSLKHGLSLKDGEKRLSIIFSIIEDEYLKVQVVDNGIGRQRAAELNDRQGKFLPHESRGLDLVRERLQILQPKGLETSLISFVDLKDERAIPQGTEVSILIPLLD